MSSAPWTADHDLDADGAKARLVEAFPELQPRDVRYFAEGYDFRMFEVDGTWLFRFPKRQQEIERLAREVALMDVLNDRLPVLVPHFAWRAPGLAGYRRLDGLPMVGQPTTAAFGATLAEFVSALQAVDVEGLALPGEFDHGGTEKLLADVRAGLDAAEPEMDKALHARCAALLDMDAPAAFSGSAQLVHNDIYPAHLLLGADGGIAAVLDWGDATMGDPVADLVVAYFWGGPRLFDVALGRYAGDVDADSRERAHFGGICMAIGHITYGARTGETDFLRTGCEALNRMDL